MFQKKVKYLGQPEKQFDDIIQYVNSLSNATKNFYENPITSETNFKRSVLLELLLSKWEKNDLIKAHNEADKDQVWGEKLYELLDKYQKEGLITEEVVDQLYIQSIEWLLGIQIEAIH